MSLTVFDTNDAHVMGCAEIIILMKRKFRYSLEQQCPQVNQNQFFFIKNAINIWFLDFPFISCKLNIV